MKKNKKKLEPRIPEIVSLNEELFSLVSGDPFAALDQLAGGVQGKFFICDTFSCGNYTGSCSAFSCGSFHIRPA